jgi:hypothetical protein
MDTLHHLSEAAHMLRRRFHVALHGIPQYKGNPNTVCQQITQDCWNGTFFQVSTGHFSLFYMRDFGMCVNALLKLGYKKEVQKTLQFALTCYSRENRITTTISKNGACFDVFSYAPDSLAFLLYSLRISHNKELVEIYRPFLEEQTQFFYDFVLDKETGLVTTKRNFSSIKDHAKRESTCYDNCCLAVVAREATLLGLKNLFIRNYSYKKIQEKIKHTFWTGDYFVESASNVVTSKVITNNVITGDANVFPYWFGIFTNKKMIRQSIAALQKEKLDQPFPLKYTSSVPKNFFFPLTVVAPNYEGNSIWMHLGLCYIDVVASVDRTLALRYVQEYKKQIEKQKNFLELYGPNQQPYESLFYYTDAGMLWCSKWLVHY